MISGTASSNVTTAAAATTTTTKTRREGSATRAPAQITLMAAKVHSFVDYLFSKLELNTLLKDHDNQH